MRLTVLLIALCCLTLVGMTQSGRFTAGDDHPMTAGDLEQLCIGSSAEAKAACRFYLLGVTQGVNLRMSIADGKTQGGRPCVPENLTGAGIELAVKTKLGSDLMVFPDDRKLEASGVVGAILVATFPCSKPH
jgi:hypothetical protein